MEMVTSVAKTNTKKEDQMVYFSLVGEIRYKTVCYHSTLHLVRPCHGGAQLFYKHGYYLYFTEVESKTE